MAGSFLTRLGDAPEEGIKAPCVVATQSNITLSGEQTVEGVAVIDGNRVLVRAQTDATENGIYNASGGAWTRSVDWNNANDVISGVLVLDADDGGIYQAKFTGSYSPDVTSLAFNPSKVSATTVTERATLTDGQLVVVLTTPLVNYNSFYVNGLNVDNGRLDDPTEVSYVFATNTVTLVDSYPAGTILTAAATET